MTKPSASLATTMAFGVAVIARSITTISRSPIHAPLMLSPLTRAK
ncbi:MAG TPA: hypothetical protein VFQ30_06300 [Ktedonobacteraceae bacterium]|nr:hypothetical protein [Ktedonobacteraceae bacterium]